MAIDLETKILVVDDQDVMRTLISKSLGILGFKRIYTAADGQEALGILRENLDMGLVVSDLRMSPMSGLQLLKNVRARYSDIPFVMVTVSDSHQDLLDAKDAGVNHYLFKPFNIEDIRKRVEVVLGGKIETN